MPGKCWSEPGRATHGSGNLLQHPSLSPTGGGQTLRNLLEVHPSLLIWDGVVGAMVPARTQASRPGKACAFLANEAEVVFVGCFSASKDSPTLM
jgi:hypothetical protein